MSDEMCFLDFQLIEMCELVNWLSDDGFFQNNKAVARYVKRVKSIR